MSESFESSILRIIQENGETIGTGFLISPDVFPDVPLVRRRITERELQ